MATDRPRRALQVEQKSALNEKRIIAQSRIEIARLLVPKRETKYRACEMGAGIAASPHLRRAKDPPVFVSFENPKVSCSPILAHQLRRRFRLQIPIRRRVLLPSAALLGPIRFRVACIPRDTAFAQDRLALPAPLPAGPIRSRSFSSSPAGGDRSFHPFLPKEDGISVPITHSL